tara:strand:- start:144 stop:380 length:237 start_codon:yes stop_codon:yes gene_type:complete
MRTAIEGYKELVKDSESGAILNIDNSAYVAAIKRQQIMNDQKQVMENNSRDINSIKSELSEIKTLLKVLIEGKITNGR